MKANYKIAIALIAGAAIGGAAIQGLHAQAKPPTYAVVDISSVTDPEGFKAIGPKAGPANEAFGGKFIMRTTNITASDGISPNRCQRRLKDASVFRSKNTSMILSRRPPNWGPFRQASGLVGIIRRQVRTGTA